MSKECRSMKPCIHCRSKGKHHRSLCPEKFSGNKEIQRNLLPREASPKYPSLATIEKNADESSEIWSNRTSISGLLSSGESVVMQTATATLKNPETSKRIVTRIFFDCGSQRSYITNDLCKNLDLRPIFEETVNVCTFGSAQKKTISSRITELDVELSDGNTLRMKVNAIPCITGSLSCAPIPVRKIYDVCPNIKFADKTFSSLHCETLQVLVGNDYYSDFFLSERRRILDGLYIIDSRLGCVISGRVGKKVNSLTGIVDSSEVSVLTTEPDPLEKLWSLDSIGIKDNPYVVDDDVALADFNSKIKLENGRYLTGWPWKTPIPKLPSNYALALGRFESLLKRLERPLN